VTDWTGLEWYRAPRWVAGGLFFIALGVGLMFDPNFRTDPKVLTCSDVGMLFAFSAFR
jgi:hypothetical protein